MNTGLGDATNFAWKIATAWNNPELDELLDTYDVERAAFARSLVSTTDDVFTNITAPGIFGRFVRTIVFPYLLPFVTWIFDVRPLIYHRISQLAISYPDSPISLNVGSPTGTIKAGERLPWVPRVTLSGVEKESNLVPLTEVGWQAHVFGDAPWAEPALSVHDVPLHSFEWCDEGGKKGFGRDVVYLVRPDGQVGLVLGGKDGVEAMGEYMRKWGVKGARAK